MNNKNIKLIVFGGDSNVGKTSSFVRHRTGEYTDYLPTKVDNEDPEEYEFDGRSVKVAFRDQEGGGEDWHRIRHFGYISAHCVVLCFSIGFPDSFNNIKTFWYPFTQKHCPKAKLMLVGMKRDLRDDKNTIEDLAKVKESPISYEKGEKLSKTINADCYLECSSLQNEGVEEVFQKAAEVSADVLVDHDIKKTKKCSLM